MLAILFLFAGTIYFGVRRALQASVDGELQSRVNGVESYLNRQVPRFDLNRIRDELEENVLIQVSSTNADLEPLGGEMLQISDGQGRWYCQSRSMQELKIAAPVSSHETGLVTRKVTGAPMRIQTASLQIDGHAFVIQVAASMAGLQATLARIANLMAWSIPVFVIAASAGGYWLSRRALTPVDRIIETSRAIGHHNLSQRLVVPQSGDELQRLSETLNEMIDRLDRAFRRVTRFTADTSHELRTPVAFIRTTAEVALLQPRQPREYQHAFVGVLTEAERMTTLIEDLLLLARADSNSVPLIRVSLDLRDVLRRAVEQVRDSALDKGIDLSLELPQNTATLVGEPSALYRLFLILIENAVKYTERDGRVKISLVANARSSVVWVRDTGIGIAEKELPLIFDRFYRSDKARQRDLGGAGLGLSIASSIADAHQTHIEVDSKLGEGSTFSIAFPR
ncbi:heavy metal sensor kinase [Granulicella aggregans]|uniref:histidine kinase n=1 Tax=Granulicella aggregans TaxID=474949 RepID=A0A7W7ZJ58_9BACT|nr:heavy metal sensor kinase [Granulicella aggregans]